MKLLISMVKNVTLSQIKGKMVDKYSPLVLLNGFQEEIAPLVSWLPVLGD